MQIKIPLFKAKALGFERDMVTFSVRYKTFRVFANAIVDTGCPFTVISENSLKRSRIPYNSSPEKNPVLIGNIHLQLRDLGVCELQFRKDNNEVVTFEQNVYAGIPMIKGYLAQELPSFIGKDFLDAHSFNILNKKEGGFLLKDE